MPVSDYKCTDCGFVQEREASSFATGSLPDWFKQTCGECHRIRTFNRVFSFGIGRVTGAGNSPGRTSK